MKLNAYEEKLRERRTRSAEIWSKKDTRACGNVKAQSSDWKGIDAKASCICLYDPLSLSNQSEQERIVCSSRSVSHSNVGRRRSNSYEQWDKRSSPLRPLNILAIGV